MFGILHPLVIHVNMFVSVNVIVMLLIHDFTSSHCCFTPMLDDSQPIIDLTLAIPA